jgi:hypothetical protein
MLDELEGRLTESPDAGTAELVRRALNSRPARLARADIRRAARSAGAVTREIKVARPARTDEQARDAIEVAEARRYTWHRAEEATAALAAGNYAEARHALEDLLRTEQAIQIVVEEFPTNPSWHSLRDELGSASDAIINALRAQLQSIERSGLMGQVRTAQAEWIRAWRPYLLVTGSNRAG